MEVIFDGRKIVIWESPKTVIIDWVLEKNKINFQTQNDLELSILNPLQQKEHAMWP